jgi:hypothetical protein
LGGGPPLVSWKCREGQGFFNMTLGRARNFLTYKKIRLLYVSFIFWGGWDVRGGFRGAVTLKMFSNVKYKRRPVSKRWGSFFFFFFASVFSILRNCKYAIRNASNKFGRVMIFYMVS